MRKNMNPNPNFIIRPELDRMINDVEALKTGHVEMRVLINEHIKRQEFFNETLASIKTVLDEERSERRQRDLIREQERSEHDHALKRTVWIASAVGPALLTTLWHLLQDQLEPAICPDTVTSRLTGGFFYG